MNDRYVGNNFDELHDNSPISGYENLPLVSYYQAVEPIMPFLNDYGSTDYVLRARDDYIRDIQYGLSDDESAAIYLYTMDKPFFRQLNRLLRAKDRDGLQPWLVYMKLFITALNKLPSVTALVWRGVEGDIKEIEKNLLIFWAVTSCSTDLKMIESFLGPHGSLYAIQCQNGKNISLFSSMQDESEILLMPGTLVRVKCEPLNFRENLLTVIHLAEENDVTHVDDRQVFMPGNSDWVLYTGGIDRQGRPHGHGFARWQGGLLGKTYDGDWEHGYRSGHGVQIELAGFKYVGGWKNDKRHGEFTRYDSLGDIISQGISYEGKEDPRTVIATRFKYVIQSPEHMQRAFGRLLKKKK